MKFYRIYIHFLALLCLSTLTVQALPLASAKVVSTKGGASYGTSEDVLNPLTEGAIVSEGDKIVTGKAGVVSLVFANGVELRIERTTSVVFSNLEQDSFWKSNPAEYPEEEISKSTTVLELQYGNVRGDAAGLREDSEFRIQTKLGDVLVYENKFFVEIYYDSFRSSFTLNAQNIDGSMDVITKFSGSVEFSSNTKAVNSFDSEADVQIVSIPQKLTMSVQEFSYSPEFRTYVAQFPKDAKSRLITDIQANKAYFDTEPEPFFNDQEVRVVSDNGTEGTANDNDDSGDTAGDTVID